jgi:HPt (histidine-containing phosphotransfer) domain-containing protein
MWLQYLPQMRERVGILETAAQDFAENRLSIEQHEAASSAAHKLAGVCGTFGLTRGTVLARELEIMYSRQNGPDPALAERLKSTPPSSAPSSNPANKRGRSAIVHSAQLPELTQKNGCPIHLGTTYSFCRMGGNPRTSTRPSQPATHAPWITPGRIDQGSSPCSRPPQSHARTPAARRCSHRLPRGLEAESSNRRPDRPQCPST